MRTKAKPKPKLMTEARLRSYLKLAWDAGRRRQRNFGEKFSAADFAAGASVLLSYVGRLDMMPADWYFGILSGKNPFADPPG